MSIEAINLIMANLDVSSGQSSEMIDKLSVTTTDDISNDQLIKKINNNNTLHSPPHRRQSMPLAPPLCRKYKRKLTDTPANSPLSPTRILKFMSVKPIPMNEWSFIEEDFIYEIKQPYFKKHLLKKEKDNE